METEYTWAEGVLDSPVAYRILEEGLVAFSSAVEVDRHRLEHKD